MNYGSVCSGIEAATVAWHPLGFSPVFFSEIEAFPNAVLKEHYPSVPNYGDMTKFKEWPCEAGSIELLVGGTPCQSFSVAGLRKGMDDPRGNLALTFLAIADRLRPEWVVWENVPGVLSLDKGRAFGSIVGGLGKLGYGWAYRVLDAQYFGVPQRRRRVFLVGHLGDWRGAAAVLLERESLSGNPPPRREAGKGIANSLTERPDRGGGNSEGQRLVARCLNAGANGRQDYETETLITGTIAASGAGTERPAGQVTHSLKAEGHDASEDGTGRGVPIIPIDMRQASRGAKMTNNRTDGGAPGTGIGEAGDPASTIGTRHVPAVAFPLSAGNNANSNAAGRRREDDENLVADCLSATMAKSISRGGKEGGRITNGIIQGGVRRLTPRECERLQGFPDDYTLVQYRKKPAADGPRYKALGNSMAVPVMRWIGRRILEVTQNTREAK